MIFDEGDFWKLTVREPFLPLVQKIVTQTELSKTLMETLAVIAFKYPIKQSDLIKIRTNKAYDHLNELEQMGYITRQKHGRTKLIKLSQKFFDYFNLPPDRLKETFSTFEGIANAIEEKEAEIKRLKEERRKEMEDAKKKEAKSKETEKDKELAKEQLSSPNTAGVGGLFEMLSDIVEGDGGLAKRVEESAARIIKLKQDMVR